MFHPRRAGAAVCAVSDLSERCSHIAQLPQPPRRRFAFAVRPAARRRHATCAQIRLLRILRGRYVPIRVPGFKGRCRSPYTPIRNRCVALLSGCKNLNAVSLSRGRCSQGKPVQSHSTDPNTWKT